MDGSEKNAHLCGRLLDHFVFRAWNTNQVISLPTGNFAIVDYASSKLCCYSIERCSRLQLERKSVRYCMTIHHYPQMFHANPLTFVAREKFITYRLARNFLWAASIEFFFSHRIIPRTRNVISSRPSDKSNGK